MMLVASSIRPRVPVPINQRDSTATLGQIAYGILHNKLKILGFTKDLINATIAIKC